jgi:hypothetical protein
MHSDIENRCSKFVTYGIFHFGCNSSNAQFTNFCTSKKSPAKIHRECALCLSDDVQTLACAEHWVYEFTIGRVSIGDDLYQEDLLQDADATILKQLLESPFS